MCLKSEYLFQQKTAKAIYAMYGDCADGLIGFMRIAMGLDTPDIVILSHECKDLHTVTIFEVKMSIKWDILGQLYKYSLYAPTYVVIPEDQIKKLESVYTLHQALKDLGIGVASVDMDKGELEIILQPNGSSGIMEHALYDAIIWQIFIDLSINSLGEFSRTYNSIVEFLRRRLKPIISFNEIPLISSTNKRIIRAIMNVLSLQKMVLPLAENPYTIELLNPDVFKLSPMEFMKQVLLSKHLGKVTSFIIKLIEKDIEKDFKSTSKQCYVPVTMLLLYTKGLPLRLIGQTYDVLCEKIRENLYECYRNIKLYLESE